MRYHQALARALSSADVPVVFGVLGDANLFFIDSYVRDFSGNYISCAHESGAVLASAAYAETTGKVGVATVTHGPGLTNTTTALVDAVRRRTPLVLLAGDTGRFDENNLQDIDQRGIVLPTGAGFIMARGADLASEDIYDAMDQARAERRPVVLNVPHDLMWIEVDSVLPDYKSRLSLSSLIPDDEVLDTAVGILASAHRPIILGGYGATGAQDELLSLAVTLEAPVATTLRGQGLFAGYPYNLGICGTLSHDLAIEMIAKSDVIAVFGATLNHWTTSNGELTAGKHVIHVDCDPLTLIYGVGATTQLIGDAGATAQTMTTMLRSAELKPSGFASPQLRTRLSLQDDVVAGISALPTESIDVDNAYRQIQAAIASDRVLIVDAGRFSIAGFRELSVSRPGAYIHTYSFASIGLAVASAVGAGIGSPDTPILVVCGDGGFMNAGMIEFNTLVRHKIKAIVIVMNDSAYGAEHMQFCARDMDPEMSLFDWPELAVVAESLGGQGHTVRTHDELDMALSKVVDVNCPVLIDIKLDPETVPTYGH